MAITLEEAVASFAASVTALIAHGNEIQPLNRKMQEYQVMRQLVQYGHTIPEAEEIVAAWKLGQDPVTKLKV